MWLVPLLAPQQLPSVLSDQLRSLRKDPQRFLSQNGTWCRPGCLRWGGATNGFRKVAKSLRMPLHYDLIRALDSTVKTLGVYLHQCCWVLGHVLLQDADARSKVSTASTNSPCLASIWLVPLLAPQQLPEVAPERSAEWFSQVEPS